MTYTLEQIRRMMKLPRKRINDWILEQEYVPDTIRKYRKEITDAQRIVLMIALHLDMQYKSARNFIIRYKRQSY